MKRKEYFIEFNKVRFGDNSYEFVITNAFLEKMGVMDMGTVEVLADTLVHKTESSMYQVTVNLKGTVEVVCDVCLEEFAYPVKGTYEFLIKQSEVERYDDDEIIYITPVTIEFDLSQFLFDSFMLSIPIKKECKMGGKQCNPAALAKLDQLHQTHEEEKEEFDPRWEKLKGITDNDK